ncbi:MAG: transferase 1, rSAM/selenodomain-associated protein [Opitutaceae bacterium]|nr:transferase 1, rSAM/selenodomain-associated protein [Opitutaceae bacterium]|tara:strand:- start:829 stop:1434 length:606 start_codon:yes stop_codon:yes gene_type:complete
MNVVALFLKVPMLGKVKTRLAEALGDEGALMAYTGLVEFLINRLEGSCIHIHYTGENLESLKQWLGDGFDYIVQEGPGLGERLNHAMEYEFDWGADKLIFLGGDCPFLEQLRVEEAFAVLDNHDVVIGPAADGGYYLIGISQKRPEVFAGVDWGTESVFQRTLEICEEKGFSFSLLPEESDVDDFEGWKKAKEFMDAGSSS